MEPEEDIRRLSVYLNVNPKNIIPTGKSTEKGFEFKVNDNLYYVDYEGITDPNRSFISLKDYKKLARIGSDLESEGFFQEFYKLYFIPKRILWLLIGTVGTYMTEYFNFNEYLIRLEDKKSVIIAGTFGNLIKEKKSLKKYIDGDIGRVYNILTEEPEITKVDVTEEFKEINRREVRKELKRALKRLENPRHREKIIKNLRKSPEVPEGIKSDPEKLIELHMTAIIIKLKELEE